MEKEFDLTKSEDVKNLSEMTQNLEYFSFEPEETYKLKLNKPKVVSKEKDFEGQTVTKYAIDVTISTRDGVVHQGALEVGNTIINAILKDPNATYTVVRTGSGLKTRYNITKDF